MTNSGSISREIGHVTDIMATLVEVSGAVHPKTYKDQPIQPLEGRSLLPIIQGAVNQPLRPLFWEHEGNRAVRLGSWKLVARNKTNWELYDIEKDRTERTDLASANPERVNEMSELYEAWAKRCNVVSPDQLPPEKRIPVAK
jgi:arylsulfatase